MDLCKCSWLPSFCLSLHTNTHISILCFLNLVEPFPRTLAHLRKILCAVVLQVKSGICAKGIESCKYSFTFKFSRIEASDDVGKTVHACRLFSICMDRIITQGLSYIDSPPHYCCNAALCAVAVETGTAFAFFIGQGGLWFRIQMGPIFQVTPSKICAGKSLSFTKRNTRLYLVEYVKDIVFISKIIKDKKKTGIPCKKQQQELNSIIFWILM